MPGQGVGESPAAEPDREALIVTAILGVLAASASALAYSTSGLLPDVDPGQQLQSYAAQPQLFQEYGWAFAFYGLFGVAFVVALGLILRRQNIVLVSVATALSAVGIFLLAFSANFWVGTLASIEAASSSAPIPADATYQAAVASNVVNYPTVAGWMAIGAGLVLFGWVVRRSGVLHDWLRFFLYVGGAAAWTPFLFGAAGGPTDTPAFPFFSNPGFPIADIVTDLAFGFFGFGAAIWIIYRLHLPFVPIGVVFLAIGLPLFLPPVGTFLHVESVLMNTPLSFLFLGTGAILILLGWRARRATPKIPEAQLQPEKPGIGTGESPTQRGTSNSGQR